MFNYLLSKMTSQSPKKNYQAMSLALIFIFILSAASSYAKRPLSVDDIMKFKSVNGARICDNGKWMAYSTLPDRGDGGAVIRMIDSSLEYAVPRGAAPEFSKDSRWVIATVKPKAADVENAGKDDPKNGLAIVNLGSGKIVNIQNVLNFILSDDSKWLAYKLADTSKKSKDNKDNKPETGNLVLRNLGAEAELVLNNVSEFKFDSLGSYLAYAVIDPSGRRNGVYVS